MNPNHILAQFGVGQMQMKRGKNLNMYILYNIGREKKNILIYICGYIKGNYDIAIPIFEKLLETELDNIEVMKVNLRWRYIFLTNQYF